MVSFTAFVLAFASLSQAIRPEQFPLDCKAELADIKPALKLGTLKYQSTNIMRCVSLGGKCTSDKDCGKPSSKDCKAEFPDVKKPIIPGPGTCIEGICRQVSQDTKQECDCLTGCLGYSTRSVRLSCQNGKCTDEPCAKCGQKPNGLRCCGSGVVDADGKCHCYKNNS